MAEVTRSIHLEVSTYDPAQRRLIPVPNAELLIEHKGGLWDPNLSGGSDVTDANGHALVQIRFEDDEESSLNPYVTVSLPEASRTLPVGAAADRRFTLPDEWVTTHYAQRRIPQITDHADANNPLRILMGLPVHLRLAYADFDTSNQRNPMALPAGTARVYLSDHDYFLFDWFIFDWLNPDDTLTGPGFDPVQGRVVNFGDGNSYPYFDAWPTVEPTTEPFPDPPQSRLDPPDAPVGTLGGGSFDQVGPLAAGADGFVFMIDGNRVLRFYPDGRLCEVITPGSPAPGTLAGLAVDQYGHLFIADRDRDELRVFRPGWWDQSGGTYIQALTIGNLTLPPLPAAELHGPCGLAVWTNPAVDGTDLLAVANAGSGDVALFQIRISTGGNRSNRASDRLSVDLLPLATVGASGSGPDQFQEPVGVAFDHANRLFVCDRQLHRVSRWGIDPATGAGTHQVTWEHSGGGSGSGGGEFDTPQAIAVDGVQGWVHVAESGNHRVQRVNADSGARLVDWQPEVSGTPAEPMGLALDPRGEVYVADAANRRLHRGSPFAAEGSLRGAGEAPRAVGTPWTRRDAEDRMQAPEYVLFDAEGRLWVSDTANDRVLLFAPDANGALTADTTAGAPTVDLDDPVGLAIDPDGMLFVVDSNNHRIRRYSGSPLALQAPDIGTGSPGRANTELDHPRGLAIVQRTEPLLYVADRDNDRVQVLQRDGTFVKSLALPAGDSFDAPEDVAADAAGNVYVADTGNGRIVQFGPDDAHRRAFPVPAPAGIPAPSGISVDPQGRLLITDRAQQRVLATHTDGGLLFWWDLRNLLRGDKATDTLYFPELAAQTVFERPTRAVYNPDGLLAVADTGHDRIRLIRTCTNLKANITDRGEELPDVMLHVITKADWGADLGLEVKVGDVSWFDDSHDFESEPLDDFAAERYEQTQVLGNARSTNAAIHVLKVVRQGQRWYQRHTRMDEAEHRWGRPDAVRKLNVDLISGEGSWQFLDVNLGMGSPDGRGPDAWDDYVLIHEMSHWVFYKAVLPYPPFTIAGLIQLSRSHSRRRLTTENLAMSEGWAEYVGLFWGYEYCPHERLRGYRMAEAAGPNSAPLQGVSDTGSAPYRYLFGGLDSAPAPAFDAPELGLRNEGYIACALYQIHCALCCPDVGFADAPSYWWGFDTHPSEAQSQRYAQTIWRALRMFPEDPPLAEIDRGSMIFLRAVLQAFHDNQPGLARIAQSIFELNNLLMPVIRITEGDSETTPGSPLSDHASLPELGIKSLVIQVTDATGRPLDGYNLHLDVTDPNDYVLSPADPGGRTQGRVVTGSGFNRVTNAHGIVRITYEAPPTKAAGSSEVVRVVYQPDFDTDQSFAMPEAGDDRETRLRRLYLNTIRTAAKTWAGHGNNLGARVSATLTLDITSA